MNKHFRNNERELVKVATFFKKLSRRLIDQGKIGEEHAAVGDAVDRFIAQLDQHANIRAAIEEQRSFLEKIVKDEASCPECGSREKLKFIGVDKNTNGWRFNRYRCRRCNIEFTWNRPNNPWDMIAYIEQLLLTLREKMEDPATVEADKAQISITIENTQANLDRLKPVIDAHDADYRSLQAREEELGRLISEFRSSLLIEKIRLESLENKG